MTTTAMNTTCGKQDTESGLMLQCDCSSRVGSSTMILPAGTSRHVVKWSTALHMSDIPVGMVLFWAAVGDEEGRTAEFGWCVAGLTGHAGLAPGFLGEQVASEHEQILLDDGVLMDLI
ncbi:hypothetical protein HYQ46_006043 [Verticillium longisporum]|nr:hypothetical protein HYQ44_012958 [Verticillium longisporum]KAG7145216.1 hypothetical protein HYQ46_006043 [Verticillium longisporum]